MTDRRELDTLLGRLEASFDAQITRAENEAASDLAFSLRQDRTLRQRVERRPCEVWMDGSWHRVAAIGPDVLVVGDPIRLLVKTSAACLRQSGGDIPGSAPEWLALLRTLARQGADIEIISFAGARATGRLAAAASDHAWMEGAHGWAAFSWTAIEGIRLVRGD
ncbi:MAG: hypothetical protein GEU78_09030 [Actinobacteria bacterium]|nr:hypothetical protein [Actinomycetota bacterium]